MSKKSQVILKGILPVAIYRVVKAMKSLYDYDPEDLQIGGEGFDKIKEKVNIKGMMVFPIMITDK